MEEISVRRILCQKKWKEKSSERIGAMLMRVSSKETEHSTWQGSEQPFEQRGEVGVSPKMRPRKK